MKRTIETKVRPASTDHQMGSTTAPGLWDVRQLEQSVELHPIDEAAREYCEEFGGQWIAATFCVYRRDDTKSLTEGAESKQDLPGDPQSDHP